MRVIGIVVFDGVTLLDASGPAEVFRLADPDHSRYELHFLSPSGGAVRSSSGIEMSGTTAAVEAPPLHTLLVAGGERLTEPHIDGELLTVVESLAQHATRVASVCTGAFLLAELGYLDGRTATTHWRHAETLARRYPRVSVRPDVIHIHDGRYMTSAGISAGIDLALAMVEHDLGVQTARTAAQEMVVFMQRPGGQAQFSSALQRMPAHSDRIRALMESVVVDPASEHTVDSMAARLHVSARHLSRLFNEELGITPARWLEQVRVDAARPLLLDGHPVTRVAQLTGFGSDEALRRAFARQLNTTPTAFRERFSTASGDPRSRAELA